MEETDQLGLTLSSHTNIGSSRLIDQKIAALNSAALKLQNSNLQQSNDLSQQAYDLCQQSAINGQPNPDMVIDCLQNLIFTNNRLGYFNKALKLILQVKQLIKGDQNSLLQAKIFYESSIAHYHLGAFSESLTFANKTLELSKMLDDQEMQARIFNHIGIIYDQFDEAESVLESFRRALEIYRFMAKPDKEAIMLNNIAVVQSNLGHHNKGLESALLSLEIATRLDNPRIKMNTLCSVGEIHLSLGNSDKALHYFHESLALASPLKVKYHEMLAKLNIGKAYCKQGHYDKSLISLHQSLQIAEAIDAKSDIYNCHLFLVEPYKFKKNFERALFHFEKYHSIKEELFTVEAEEKLNNLRIVHDIDAAQKESEIHRLKNVELIKEIVQRQQTETELMESREQFRRAMLFANIGLIEWDVTANVLRGSDLTFSILGIDSKDATTSSADFLNIVNQNDVKRVNKKIQSAIKNSAHLDIEFQTAKFENEKKWIRIQGDFIQQSKGDNKFEIGLGIVEDISLRKASERMREDMENMTHHDLKSPLNAIINLPQLLMLDKNLTEEQRKSLGIITDAGYGMLRLINNTLNLVKMEQGDYQSEKVNIDIRPILKKVQSEVQSLCQGLDVRLSITGCDVSQPFEIIGEELLCYSLLSNLIKNAIEASSSGDLVIIELVDEGKREIMIHNQGLVPESIAESFFDKYSTAGKKNGIGIGTYSAKMMTEAQNGTIKMASSKVDGTTVSLSFPIPNSKGNY